MVRNVSLTSTSYSSGRVQVYIDNNWGYICDDFRFDTYEADVICHQLGYSGASSYSRSAMDTWVFKYTFCVNITHFGYVLRFSIMRYFVSYRFEVDSDYNFLMSEVYCSTSDYLVILQCSYSSITESCERNGDEVSVFCCESFSMYFMCL